ncbi:processive 1,2-diacylglycerol beta-glucosyltransferase [Paenibacillus polymyxa]|uniref:MGDG synthase family glycosyltransferase n=1 Tax=Paenibacillus polymyxa TaxID=1406 RepID=UPI00278E53F5|nr:glycosyltransferase [Paenibacillus polymyxa]MDQ0046465.1 processive 1,2-diacylglycerol beta-glucosyltransferase [Paenibacillus polymyxa]
MNSMKREKLLILSGALGDGHMQAAKAILEASVLYKQGVEVVDFMQWIHPRMHVVERYCFLQWVKYFPSSYGYMYQKTRTDSTLTFFLKHFLTTSLQRLLKLLNEEQPTLIVSTFPLASAAISLLKEKGMTDLPAATVITDHSDHSYWIHPSTDLYLVGSEGVRAALQRKGVADHKIAVTGIPVRPSYSQHDNKDRLREKLALALDAFVVLVMGGGCGIIDKSFIEQMQSDSFPPNVQFVIVCGRNVKLLYRLREALGDRDNVILTGFLEGIHEWMASADVLITKPGGLTTSEALALQLPMLLLEPRLGQEKDNADYLIQAGVAYLCQTDNLQDQIQRLVQQPSLLEEMREKTGLCRQQDSARHAVMQILSMQSDTQEEKWVSSLQQYA